MDQLEKQVGHVHQGHQGRPWLVSVVTEAQAGRGGVDSYCREAWRPVLEPGQMSEDQRRLDTGNVSKYPVGSGRRQSTGKRQLEGEYDRWRGVLDLPGQTGKCLE